MKRLLFGLLVLVPAIMVACGKNNDDQSSTAATPLTTQCLQNPYLCQNSQYGFGNYQQYGFAPYPNQGYGYSYGYSYGYQQSGYNTSQVSSCACQSYYGYGAIAVYSNLGGAGCAGQQAYAPVQGLLGLYSLGASNTQWVNITQVSNIPSSSGNSCNQVAQACYANQPNGGCQTGYSCYVNQGAPIGLCVRQ